METSTLDMLEQVKKRESLIQDQVLDQFCQVIVDHNPGLLSGISDEEMLHNKAAHWRKQLKENRDRITILNMSSAGLKRLPDEISNLTALTQLGLYKNKLITPSEIFWYIFGQSQTYRLINHFTNNGCTVFY